MKHPICFFVLLALSFSLSSQNNTNFFLPNIHLKGIEDTIATNVLNNYLPVESSTFQGKELSSNNGTVFVVITNNKDEHFSILDDAFVQLENSKMSIEATELVFKSANCVLVGFRYKNRKDYFKFLNTLKVDGINLFEFIHFKKYLTKPEMDKLFTYLSIKFGKTLNDNHYISSQNDTLFSTVKNNFKFDVIGIGRDDHYPLHQKKSINSESKLLTISLNSSKSFISDLEFLFLGHNNKESQVLESTKASIENQRIWKIENKLKNEYNLVLHFDKSEFINETEIENLHLLLSSTQDFNDKVVIKPDFNDSTAVVYSLKLKPDDNFYFMLFQPKEMELMYVFENCYEELYLTVLGGQKPFQVLSGNYNTKIAEDTVTLKTKDIGQYILVEDSRGTRCKLELDMTNPFLFSGNISLFVDDFNKEVVVDYPNEFDLSNGIYFKNYKISNDNIFIPNQTGVYEAKFVDPTLNCEKTISVEVLKNTQSKVTLYPNIVSNGETFLFEVITDEENEGTFSIYDIHGKIINEKKLGISSNFKYSGSIETSGIYLLSMNVGKHTYIKKLIVK